MNIYDISHLAGVSIATVSRVLNGSGHVSEKTRSKVLDVIRQEGYTPNVFARGLGLNTMKTIGLLCTDASDIYQAKAIYHIEELLRNQGYDSILCCSGYTLTSKQQCMSLLLTKKVDALILIGSSFVYDDAQKDAYIREAAGQVPVMLLNASLEWENVYGVVSDDSKAVYDAVMQLSAAGNRDILYFYDTASHSGKRKLSGYRQSMTELGLLRENLIHYFGGGRENIPAMADYLLQLYKNGLRFSAVVASDDHLALGAVKFARRAGLSVPGDLSVIGYNNSMLTRCADPELTSVDVHLEELCQQLVTKLMQVLAGESVTTLTSLPAHIHHRQTTNDPPVRE